jgi:hypothetical protein
MFILDREIGIYLLVLGKVISVKKVETLCSTFFSDGGDDVRLFICRRQMTGLSWCLGSMLPLPQMHVCFPDSVFLSCSIFVAGYDDNNCVLARVDNVALSSLERYPHGGAACVCPPNFHCCRFSIAVVVRTFFLRSKTSISLALVSCGNKKQ